MFITAQFSSCHLDSAQNVRFQETA